MLPVGHIACSWALLSWLQAQGKVLEIDYRGAAMAALLPDLIDKPITLTFMSGSGTSQGPCHTLLGQSLLTAATAQLKQTWIPYALLANSHLLLDQMWKYPRTLFFPFSGRFDRWKFMGTPSAMLEAYAEIATRPEIVVVEAIGVALLGWFVRQHRLHKSGPLKRFLRAGRLDSSPQSPTPYELRPDGSEGRPCA